MLLPEFDGFAAVAGFADQRHVGFITLNHGDQAFTHNAMIIGDKDTNAGFQRTCARGVLLGGSRGTTLLFRWAFAFLAHITPMALRAAETRLAHRARSPYS